MKNTFVISFMFCLMLIASIAWSKIIYVDDDNTKGPWDGTPEHPYQYIQDGIDAASSKDTIIVKDGIYTEGVDVKKSLTVESENGAETTIVQGVFEVSSDYVTISGFTVKGALGLGAAGIRIWSWNSNTIIGNNISSNYYGIDIWSGSNNNSVTDNIVSNNEDNGIMIDVYSDDNTISGNNISSNGDSGIEMWESSNNSVTDNTISSNGTDGIRIQFSSNGNTISGNSISSNSSGIYLSGVGSSFPNDNTVSGNTFSNNNSGIVLSSGSTNTTVTNNIVSDNNNGIRIAYCTNNQITNNTVLNSSQYGIHVQGHEKSHFDNLIDTTNTVNGKPVYYYFDESNKVIKDLDTTHLTLAYCSNFTVINSNISNGDGVYLYMSDDNIFDGNDISSNNVDGIYLYGSDDNDITDNNISFNKERGVYLWNSGNNDITGNTVSNNKDGIWGLDYVNRNIITGNKVFSNNGIGVYLRGEMGNSRENIIAGNDISLNSDYGIYLFKASKAYGPVSNLIYHNNLTDNTQNAGDYSGISDINFWDNGSEGNYWSDYTGEDADRDCIGDTPYEIPGDAGAKDNYPLMKPYPLKPGDVSGDGFVTAYDASLVLQHVVGLIELSPVQQEAADVTGNSAISALDAAFILQYTVGLITEFPSVAKVDAPSRHQKTEEEFLVDVIAELETVSLSSEQQQVFRQLKQLLQQLTPPKHVALFPNFPNPFNPDTWIPYQLVENSEVTIRIYNVTGQLIRILNLGRKSAGYYLSKHKAGYWDGKDSLGQKVASGIYYYTLKAGSFTATRKMVILK